LATQPQSYPDGAGFEGAQGPFNESSEWNVRVFQIQQQLARIATCMPVKVIAVHDGGIGPTGTVDIQPLVNQIDGRGQATSHGIIFGVPYCRIQGGVYAVILDPVAGDIGLAGFCSRDISSVKATRARANPGSRRQYDWADAVYIGGMLNGTPTRYISFGADAINIVAPTINLIGNVETTGTLKNNGVNVGSTHVHGSVQTGSGTTGGPT
jgi:hypothetical protein